MKKLIISIALFLPLFCLAQDISIEDSLIKVDGVPYAKVAREGKGFFGDKTLSFFELDGKPALVVKYYDIRNVKSAYGNGNQNGEVLYGEISFFHAKQKGQVQNLPMKIEKVVKRLVKAKIFKDGKVDDEAVSNFVLVNPVEFSRQH